MKSDEERRRRLRQQQRQERYHHGERDYLEERRNEQYPERLGIAHPINYLSNCFNNSRNTKIRASRY
jgi:hypothetical protein